MDVKPRRMTRSFAALLAQVYPMGRPYTCTSPYVSIAGPSSAKVETIKGRRLARDRAAGEMVSIRSISIGASSTVRAAHLLVFTECSGQCAELLNCCVQAPNNNPRSIGLSQVRTGRRKPTLGSLWRARPTSRASETPAALRLAFPGKADPSRATHPVTGLFAFPALCQPK